jgi:hypothetical protein
MVNVIVHMILGLVVKGRRLQDSIISQRVADVVQQFLAGPSGLILPIDLLPCSVLASNILLLL